MSIDGDVPEMSQSTDGDITVKSLSVDGDVLPKKEKEKEKEKERVERERESDCLNTNTRASENPETEQSALLASPSSVSVKKMTSIRDDVLVIFAYWVAAMGKGKTAKLTKQRETCISARIKDGYTLDQIKAAIDGCAKSPYHQGKNEAGTIYDDLTLICRSGDKLEQFAGNVCAKKPTGDLNERNERHNEKNDFAELYGAAPAITDARTNAGAARKADGAERCGNQTGSDDESGRGRAKAADRCDNWSRCAEAVQQGGD